MPEGMSDQGYRKGAGNGFIFQDLIVVLTYSLRNNNNGATGEVPWSVVVAGRRIMEARTVTASPAMAPADGLYLAAVDYGDFSRRSKPTMGMPSSPSSSQE
eukprot:TRINITY_DN952_c0_g1_i5.p2 TRINITY_DN952_c0_g1~~TRINITY_DN952_c0_g1_i5.p2  ORF type:complete len:101 (+),score=15.19 TRINITY_DN952_c0_g1_i5:531-833(+)